MVHPSKGCDRQCCSGNGRRVIDDARWWRRAAIGGVLAFAVLRLATLTHYPPWTDEVWTFGILPQTFRRLLRWFAGDQRHRPTGLLPPAALIRRGYRMGLPVFSLGTRDFVIALPFSRTVQP